MRSEGSPWGLLVALLGSVAAAGLSDVPSPENYLRKATASATLIGNYVYIDGGEIAQLVDGKVPSFRTTNQVNSTLSIDMSKSWNASTVVQRTIDRPWWSKVNQVIWTNHEAGTFYVWGGKWIWGDNMTKNELWKFTPDGKGAGTWSIEPPANADLFNGLHESEFGAYANTNDTGFVIGGIASGWTEYGRASTSVLPGMVTFNMQTNVWQNGTTAFSPFGTLAGARAHYIPTFGPNGLVMVLGGQSHSLVGDPDWSAATPYDLRNLTFFDPQTKKQYWQATTGSIPPFPRTFFCLAGFQNTDGGYEILLAGGSNERDKFLYQDTYILSLPGFVWVKAADSPSGKRRDAACVSVGNRQVLSIGGTDGTWTDPDPAPQGLQLFDMTEMQWKYSYDANAAAYERPADLAVWYKNGSFDAVQWTSDEVRQLFTVKSTNGSSGSGSDSSSSPSATTKSTPVGAIAGGVVGGVAGLAIIGAVAWLMIRRKRSQQQLNVTDGNGDFAGYHDGYYAAEPKPEPTGPEPKGSGAIELFSGRHHAELGDNTAYASNPLLGQPMSPAEMDATPAR